MMGIKSMGMAAARGAVVVGMLAGPIVFAAQASANTVNTDNNCAFAATANLQDDCNGGLDVLVVGYRSLGTASASATFIGDVSTYTGITIYNGSPTTYHYVFGEGGSGNGAAVWKDAASARSCGQAYRIYSSTDYTGTQQTIANSYDCSEAYNLAGKLYNGNESQAYY